MASDEGLVGTVGTRLKVASTSSAVKSVPSWNFTPLRSLNSQVVSSIARQLSARPGFRCCCSSCFTSGSKKCFDMPLFGERLWKCGSSEVTGVDSAMESSCAAPGSDRKAASAASRVFLMRILPSGSGKDSSDDETFERLRCEQRLRRQAPRREALLVLVAQQRLQHLLVR